MLLVVTSEFQIQMSVQNVIIIGSGPAAHTAAIYAARANLSPLVFEGFMAGGVAAGGQLTTTTVVENFPGFPDGIQGQTLMDNMREQSLRCGAIIITETIESVNLKCDDGNFRVYTEGERKEYVCKSLIIATGATAKRLGCRGEDEYWNRGVSACAVCDGALPMFRNKPVVVIGGGDTAAEEALHMSHYASNVYMLVRGDKLRASKAMISRLQKDSGKIEILYNTSVQCIQGDKSRVTHVEFTTGPTSTTRQTPNALQVSGVFYAIGHVPNTAFLGNQVELHDNGYIKTRDMIYTNIPGVFACGDVQDFIYRQAITAAGTGCMAALACEHWLQQH